jgi:RimJ/RimL family protein N-acetyltransferase
MCGLLKRDNLENPDIGFALLPDYIGQGYGYEIAQATVKFALKELKLLKLSAITKPGNRKSIRLIEKIGLKFEKTFRMTNDEEELLLYSNEAL